jgi:hypothetical protein
VRWRGGDYYEEKRRRRSRGGRERYGGEGFDPCRRSSGEEARMDLSLIKARGQ